MQQTDWIASRRFSFPTEDIEEAFEIRKAFSSKKFFLVYLVPGAMEKVDWGQTVAMLPK